MRVSSNTIFESGIGAINRQTEALLKTQQQLSTGRRVVTPADDPVAAARALQVEQADAANTQYGVNGKAATATLGLAEQALAQSASALQNMRERVIQAGNGSFTSREYAAIAADVRGLRAELFGAANATDGEGLYLFAGYQAGARPFVQGIAGVQYVGDDGVRLAQVSAASQVAISDSGAQTFMRIPQGNGTFVVSAAAGNAGSGTYDLGSVVDRSALTGADYRIDFSVSAGVTTYDVVNVTSGATVLAAQPYTSGAAIEFDGIRVQIELAPADGDRFDIAPNRSQDVFTTIDRLLQTLDSAVTTTDAGRAAISNGLATALGNIDQALDRVIGARASVGSRLREVESIASTGEDLSLQYQQTLSNLRDVDYARAITDLTRQQTFLEAAQQSFIRISSLSLFDFLR
jgi:flagellar hook-associated protein 3 FlgL